MMFKKNYLMFLIFLILFCVLNILPELVFSQTQTHFQVVPNTGISSNIVIPMTINPAINSQPLVAGDEIGVFNAEGICCGAKTWNGVKNIALTVFGEILTPMNSPGMKKEEAFQYRIWSVADQFEYTNVVVTYQTGDGLYLTNSFHVLNSITAYGYSQPGNDHSLLSVNPNPCKDNIKISFEAPIDSPVNLYIVNLIGVKKADVFVNQPFSGGRIEKDFNVADYVAGFYYCVLKSDKGTTATKFQIIR